MANPVPPSSNQSLPGQLAAGSVLEHLPDGLALVREDDTIIWSNGLLAAWCGKPDLRGAYGLLGQEMIGWLTHLQHTPSKNVWLVGLLNKQLDDFNRPYFSLQVEGSKTGLELPGIVDEVITLAELPRWHGHYYNWYDTGDLHLLEPHYVSTVDSGNLAGHQLTLSQACRDMLE